MLKKYPVYPIFFSIFPVLALAAYNIQEISLDVVFRPLLVSLALGIILFGLMKWILRDWYRAALATDEFLSGERETDAGLDDRFVVRDVALWVME